VWRLVYVRGHANLDSQWRNDSRIGRRKGRASLCGYTRQILQTHPKPIAEGIVLIYLGAGSLTSIPDS
jgi:hypothetical protein